MRENPRVLRPAVYVRAMLSLRLGPVAWHRSWKLKPPGPRTANLMPLPTTNDCSPGGLVGVKMSSSSCGLNFLLCSAREARLGPAQGDGEEVVGGWLCGCMRATLELPML